MVRTYVDRIIGYVWTVFGLSAFLLSCVAVFWWDIPILFTILLLMGMGTAVQAVRAVDECVGRVVDAILEQGGKAIITADHGNAEQMIDYETGMPYTAHTVFNPVPFILADEDNRGVALREDGRLADLAPTLLDMMGIPQPEEMTGKSMIVH